MYPVSNAYKKRISSGAMQFDVYGTIGSTNITAANVMSLSITNQCSSESEVRVGQVYVGQLNMTVVGIAFTIRSLIGQPIVLYAGPKTFGANAVLTDGNNHLVANENDAVIAISSDDVYDYAPLGIYYIDSAMRTQSGIEIVAYDRMAWFDAEVSGLLNGTPYSILSACCRVCGVPFGMTQAQIQALPNGNYSATCYSTNDITVYRDIISWVAQFMGCYATIDRAGQLVLRTYKMTVDEAIDPTRRFMGGSFSDYVTFYSAMVLTDIETNVDTRYARSTDNGLTYTLGSNPYLQTFANSNVKSTVLNTLLNAITSFQYVPFTAELAPDPKYDLGDVISFTGGIADSTVKYCITQFNWAYNRHNTLVGVGRNAAYKGQPQLEKQVVLANQKVKDAQTVADNAQTTANTAQTAANNAQTTANNAQTAANNAAKVATNYITDTTNGTFVHAEGTPGNPSATGANGVHITNTVDIIRNGVSVANYGDVARIGKSGETRAEIAPRSLQLIDKDNVTYLYASDLRDDTGYAEISETFQAIGDLLYYTTATISRMVEVKVNNVATTNYTVASAGNYFRLGFTPTRGSIITAKYTTNGSQAKAYTFGTRESGSVMGPMSFVGGLRNIASGGTSAAFGYLNEASGGSSFVTGDECTASGADSFAQGYLSGAFGWASHAEGVEAVAKASAAHAEGSITEANGDNSHAEGCYTRANGDNSHAGGYGTKASSNEQTVIGRYNEEDANDKYAFIIGNGTGFDAENRENILTVDWDGNIWTPTDSASVSNANFTILNIFKWGRIVTINFQTVATTTDITVSGLIPSGFRPVYSCTNLVVGYLSGIITGYARCIVGSNGSFELIVAASTTQVYKGTIVYIS